MKARERLRIRLILLAVRLVTLWDFDKYKDIYDEVRKDLNAARDED